MNGALLVGKYLCGLRILYVYVSLTKQNMVKLKKDVTCDVTFDADVTFKTESHILFYDVYSHYTLLQSLALHCHDFTVQKQAVRVLLPAFITA